MFLGGTYNHFQVQKQFKGILPNDHLVKKFGSRNYDEIIASFEKEHKNLYKNEEVSTKPKYPMIYLNPSYSFVLENLDNDDISHILIFGGIALVVCYGVFGKLCYFLVFSLLND
jgi:protoheme ferro-lyase